MPQLAEHGFPDTIQIEDLITLVHEVGEGVASRQNAIAGLATQYKATGRAIVSKTGDIETDVWVERKKDGSTLTSADVWGNDRLISGLQRLTTGASGIGIVTEENNPNANLAATVNPFVVTGDSLDNTSADNGFLQGGNDWAIMIGCINTQTGQSTGGVIYYPKRGLTFYTGRDNQVYMRRDGIEGDIPVQGTEPRTLDNITQNRPLEFLVSRGTTLVDGQEPIKTGIDESLSKHYDKGSYFDRCLPVAIPPEQREQYGLASANADVVTQGGWSFWDLVPFEALLERLGRKAYNLDGTEVDCMAAVKNGFKLPDTILLGHQKTLENIGFPVSVGRTKNAPEIQEQEKPAPINTPRRITGKLPGWPDH